MQNRQAVFTNLLSALSAVLTPTGIFPPDPAVKVTMDYRSIETDENASMPAVYVVVLDEPPVQDSDDPPIEKINFHIEVHMDKDNLIDKDATSAIFPILDAIDKVVGREAKDKVTQRDQTLGGLVRWCRRSGPTKYFLDVMATKCAVVVPCQILNNH